MKKVKVGIIGSGNIGTDLLFKLLRSSILDPVYMVGVVETSDGLQIAGKKGLKTTFDGINGLLKDPLFEEIKLVYDASGAKPHLKHAPILKKAGKIAIDLTPAAVGPYVVPYINLKDHLDKPNVNLITCGAQATVPLVRAISNVTKVNYAEIVSSIASKSAGIGTRQNIDEFTQTTARALEVVGGAKKGKAIIVLNPAEPPITMQNTVYAMVENPDVDQIQKSLDKMVSKIQTYVPGYRLKHTPEIDGNKVTIQVQVRGSGDYLPEYSGNLDIITCAAVAAGEEISAGIMKK